MKVKQICEPVLCDEEPYQHLVGKIATWFCCKKGFLKSLDEFSEYYANKYHCHVCNDKQIVKSNFNGHSIPCPAQCYLTNKN